MSLKFTLTLLLGLTVLQNTIAQNRKSPPKPNVVFILVDDLGLNDLSCTGSKFYETPNVDRIANEGTVFTQGYACSGVCSPSRASIMTGQFTARHGITDWIGSGTAWRQKNVLLNFCLPNTTTHYQKWIWFCPK